MEERLSVLKDIGADDFTETTLESILVDFLPDEASKEVNMKVETIGRNSVSLKTLQALIEKIMAREKDRTESKRDRQGRPACSLEEQGRTCPQEQHPVTPEEKSENIGYYWGDCWGGYIAMAVKRGPDGADEPVAKIARPEDQDKGKDKGKGKGKGRCHICNEEGRYQAQRPQRCVCSKDRVRIMVERAPLPQQVQGERPRERKRQGRLEGRQMEGARPSITSSPNPMEWMDLTRWVLSKIGTTTGQDIVDKVEVI